MAPYVSMLRTRYDTAVENVFVKWRADTTIKSEKRSISECIISVPECPSTRPDIPSVVASTEALDVPE